MRIGFGVKGDGGRVIVSGRRVGDIVAFVGSFNAWLRSTLGELRFPGPSVEGAG